MLIQIETNGDGDLEVESDTLTPATQKVLAGMLALDGGWLARVELEQDEARAAADELATLLADRNSNLDEAENLLALKLKVSILSFIKTGSFWEPTGDLMAGHDAIRYAREHPPKPPRVRKRPSRAGKGFGTGRGPSKNRLYQQSRLNDLEREADIERMAEREEDDSV
jgi:hypothetical protein